MAASLDIPLESLGTHTVGFEGFSDFERAAIASYFRLTFSRTPSYRQATSSATADFLVADADNGPALEAVLRERRIRDTVFIGARVPPSALAWLPRPIDPKQIVRELDSLVEHKGMPQQTDFGFPTVPGNDLAAMALQLPEQDTSFYNTEAAGLSEPEIGGHTSSLWDQAHPEHEAEPVSLLEPSMNRRPTGPVRDVLVVEDSAIARKFLARRLQLLGYRVHTADSGESALTKLEQRRFTIVFLDVMLGPAGSIDGWHLCQTLRKLGADDPARRSAIVMVTGLAGPTDRVRGSLAGCDAYLTKPLIESDFIAALRRVDPAFQFEPRSHASV